jgi:tetratricopeptide (TPR) repeat protein
MERTSTDVTRDLMRLGNVDEARKIAEEEIDRIGSEANTNETWRLRFIKAETSDTHGRIEEALQYLESFAPPDVADVESRAGLKMYRAYYCGYLGRYEASHRLFEEAETIARDACLLESLGDIHLSRAFISFRQKDYVSSDGQYRCALKLSEEVGGWYLRGHGLWGIGKNLMIQEHYSEAVPWLQESLGIFEKAEARLAIATVWSELAVCYLGLGDDVRAMEVFRQAERVNCECGSVHNYQVVLANIGNVYLHRRDYFTAISYYQRALSLAREIKDPVSIKKWTRNINLAYARIRLSVDQTNPRIA